MAASGYYKREEKIVPIVPIMVVWIGIQSLFGFVRKSFIKKLSDFIKINAGFRLYGTLEKLNHSFQFKKK